MVMRLLRGGDAGDRARQGPMTTADVQRVVAEVGGALAVAHARGIVHGDLGPGDVLFDEHGHAYLGDLGRAPVRRPSRGRRRRPTAGRARGRPSGGPGARRRRPGDQSALARLAELLATGGDPARMRRGRPGLAAAIRRATAADPAARYPDVAAFVDAVADVVGRPGDGCRPRRGRRARPCRRGTRTRACGPSPRPTPPTSSDGTASSTTLVERLARPGADGRFVAVVGPSGSGKSSVVRAGLVPAVRRGAVRARPAGSWPRWSRAAIPSPSWRRRCCASRCTRRPAGRRRSPPATRRHRASGRPGPPRRRLRAAPRGRPVRGAVHARRGRRPPAAVPRRAGRGRHRSLRPAAGRGRRCGPTSTTGRCASPASPSWSRPTRSR